MYYSAKCLSKCSEVATLILIASSLKQHKILFYFYIQIALRKSLHANPKWNLLQLKILRLKRMES